MTGETRDVEFVSAIERERAVLQGTAFLLLDDPTSAAQLLDATLAQLYARQLAPAELRIQALRSLVRDDAGPELLPWAHAQDFALVDGPSRVGARGIVAELGRLPRDQRAVIVLERFTELPSVQIADVLDRRVDEVLVLARQARAALIADRAELRADDRLADELRSAIPDDWRVAHGALTDLAHGQRLVRRTRLRRASAALAAVVVLVVLTSLIWPRPVTVPLAVAPAVGPTPVIRASCDTSGRTCQAETLQAWRAEMARVANSHLDPGGGNAFGYDQSDDDAQAASFWAGHGGTLTLDLVRLDQGGTQVSVQIASSSELAVVCGATTRTTCGTLRFMDGNRVTVSDDSPNRGVEVQYSPYGDEVITAIARTAESRTPGGEAVSISRADLIDLVEDHRLRLPSR